MKNTFKIVAIALVAMAMTTACNNKPAEEVEDTTAMEVVEEVVVEEETPAVEEVAEATTVKKEETNAEKLAVDMKVDSPKKVEAASKDGEKKDVTVKMATPDSKKPQFSGVAK